MDQDNKEKQSDILPLTKTLYGVASLSSFSNILINQFLGVYGVVLGATFKMMGVITSTQNLFSNLLQVYWGGLSDRKGKRLFIALGYLLNGFVIVGFLVLKNPVFYVVLVGIFSIFWSMTIPAWNSLLGDYSEATSRGKTFGVINAVIQISSVTAMILVALITFNSRSEAQVSNFTIPFTLSAVTSVVCSLMVIFTKEKKPVTQRRKLHILSGFKDDQFRQFLTASLLHSFAMSFAWPIFPYVTIKIVQAEVWQIAVISAISSFSSSFIQRFFGGLSDKIGRRPLVIIGRMSLFAYPLAMRYARHWTHLLIINSVIFTLTSFLWMIEPVYVIDQAPETERGLYIASNNAVAGIGSFIGSLSGGVFTERLLTIMVMNEAISIGLLTSVVLRVLTSLSYLRIKETLPKGKKSLVS